MKEAGTGKDYNSGLDTDDDANWSSDEEIDEYPDDGILNPASKGT